MSINLLSNNKKKVADRGKIVDCEISPTMGKQLELICPH